MWYDVRWSRKAKVFVAKEESGEEHPFIELYGMSKMVGADNENLHLHMDGDLTVNEKQIATFSLPEDFEMPPVPEGAELLFEGLCRICARRNMNDFRFRLENNLPDVHYAPAFEGVANWLWTDHKSHLHHNGKGYRLLNGNIWLAP